MLTGIPYSVWLDEGDRVIATASEVLDEIAKKQNPRPQEG